MIGTAWPSLSTSRSLSGFHGSLGSQRIWWYISTVTRWASDSAVDGCPLPAAVVISTDNFPISTAFLLTAASKLMGRTPLRLFAGRSRTIEGTANNHAGAIGG